MDALRKAIKLIELTIINNELSEEVEKELNIAVSSLQKAIEEIN